MNGNTRAGLARRVLPLLDLTELSDECRPSAIDALCKRAATQYGPVAAVCIWPQYVKQAARALQGSAVSVATVINFPAGGEDVDRAVEDSHEALADGAGEIDLVMPYRALLRGEPAVARSMIRSVAEILPQGKILKVIIETGAMRTDEAIASACRIAIEAGAHFIKTSTGKIPVSATPEAARVILQEIRSSQRAIGFKAAGGIRTCEEAKLYLDLGDEIMGDAWARKATFRFGASRLLDAVLAALDGSAAETTGSY